MTDLVFSHLSFDQLRTLTSPTENLESSVEFCPNRLGTSRVGSGLARQELLAGLGSIRLEEHKVSD